MERELKKLKNKVSNLFKSNENIAATVSYLLFPIQAFSNGDFI